METVVLVENAAATIPLLPMGVLIVRAVILK